MSGLFPTSACDRIRVGRRHGLRHVLDGAAWNALATAPPSPAEAPLVMMWGDDDGLVHALFHEGRTRPLIASVQTEGTRYHALSATLPAAVPFERRLEDLRGFEPMFAAPARPLLDDGSWSATHPLASRPGPPGRPAPVEWLDGPDPSGTTLVEQGPVGGVLPGLRVRVALLGTTVQRLEFNGAGAHRGVETAMLGLAAPFAGRLAARIDADGGAAHALAFARAVEHALAVAIPRRSAFLRAVALETIGAAAQCVLLAGAAESAGASLLATVAADLAADWRAAAGGAFGHRFGAGWIVPGGVAADLDPSQVALLGDVAARTEAALPRVAALYEGPRGLAALLGRAGRIAPAACRAATAGGPVARASGDTFDARRAAPRDAEPEPPAPLGSERGTTDARFRLRIAAVGAAAARVRRLLATLPPGVVALDLPIGAGEGIGVAEGPNGDVWHVVRLDADGTVASVAVRDPAIAHATLASEAATGADVALLGPTLRSLGLTAEALAL